MRPVLVCLFSCLCSLGLSLGSAGAQPSPDPDVVTEPAEPPAGEDSPDAVAVVGPSDAAAVPDGEAAFPSEDEATQRMLAGFAMTDEQRRQYAAELRAVVAQIRGKVLAKITSKLQGKQASKLDRFAIGLLVFASCGVLLLGMPLVLRKKYPGKGGLLFKYSALAAGLFALAVTLFAAVLMVMRTTQGVVGEYTNPQVQIVESTFDLFDSKAEDLAMIGPLLVEPTLASLTGDSDQPVISQMLENVQRFKQDFSAFSSVARFFDKVDWLFGMLPIILIGIALLLFARVARPTLTEIVRLPERAASGEGGAVRATVKLTLRNVWAEAKSAFAALGLLVVLTMIAAALLGFVLQPALEVFISYLTLALLYVQMTPNASTFWVMFSLGASIVFLVLNLAVVILSSAFFLSKAQAMFQRKFREGEPLANHARFWKWGAIGTLWAQVLPVLYILVAVKGIGWLAEKSMERWFDAEHPAESSWGLLLASGPAMFLVTFAIVFWAARGFAALKYIVRYKVAPAPR